MERKLYKFKNGIQAHQEELSIEQDYRIAELMTELEIPGFEDIEKMQIQNLIKLLASSGVLEKFLEVILLPAKDTEGISAEKLKTLKNSEVQKVMDDFFTLNPLVKSLLQNLKDVLAFKTKNPRSSYSEQNIKNTKQAS
jgi:hypothetical protein